MERGAAQAVADVNTAGGVLGQQVQLYGAPAAMTERFVAPAASGLDNAARKK